MPQFIISDSIIAQSQWLETDLYFFAFHFYLMFTNNEFSILHEQLEYT